MLTTAAAQVQPSAAHPTWRSSSPIMHRSTSSLGLASAHTMSPAHCGSQVEEEQPMTGLGWYGPPAAVPLPPSSPGPVSPKAVMLWRAPLSSSSVGDPVPPAMQIPAPVTFADVTLRWPTLPEGGVLQPPRPLPVPSMGFGPAGASAMPEAAPHPPILKKGCPPTPATSLNATIAAYAAGAVVSARPEGLAAHATQAVPLPSTFYKSPFDPLRRYF